MALVVPLSGRLVATGNRYEPYRLLDPDGALVEAVTAHFRDLLAAGRAESTVRSYGLDLLRWFRFLWSDVGVAWDRATRVEARDFSRWMHVAGKRPRPHWRAPDAAVGLEQARGRALAPSVRAHYETVLRSFYDFHRDAGTGPVINPFPLDRSRRGGRAHAHHNPMELYGNQRSGRYRPGCPTGSRAVSPIASSTRSSPGCPRTVIGRWSPSTCRPVRGRRSCCRRRWRGWIRGGI
jgi:Phage integrase, N-terminal SAM-like domain